MAECMGLHRDGETYGMSPLETNLRRLIWHQLCFLDIRTCEATGPRPIIRREDFDTRFPLNVDDIDLHASGDPPVTENRWTDATFSLIRMEINEMIRTIWVDRTRLERRKVTLTAVLSKIETFKANMAARYDHLMDDRIPVQKCARVVKALLLSRLLTMVLHRYHNSVASPMPDRLRKLMISGGIITLETAITLETSPDLRSWTWYSGALQQYHTAVLFLMEIVIYPDRKEAARIWPLCKETSSLSEILAIPFQSPSCSQQFPEYYVYSIFFPETGNAALLTFLSSSGLHLRVRSVRGSGDASPEGTF